MSGPSEAARQRLRRSVDDRFEAIWALRRAEGHETCIGWQYDSAEARLICSCGEVIATEGKWGASDA